MDLPGGRLYSGRVRSVGRRHIRARADRVVVRSQRWNNSRAECGTRASPGPGVMNASSTRISPFKQNVRRAEVARSDRRGHGRRCAVAEGAGAITVSRDISECIRRRRPPRRQSASAYRWRLTNIDSYEPCGRLVGGGPHAAERRRVYLRLTQRLASYSRRAAPLCAVAQNRRHSVNSSALASKWWSMLPATSFRRQLFDASLTAPSPLP